MAELIEITDREKSTVCTLNIKDLTGDALDYDSQLYLEGMAKTQHPCTILDLSKVANMNSAGLGVLITLNKRHQDAGKPFLLANVNFDVRKVMSIAQVVHFFKMFDSIEEAEASASP